MKTTHILSVILITAIATSSHFLNAKEPQSPELIGYCPVAYVMAGKVIKGNPDYKHRRWQNLAVLER